ncbi:hypothetical protein E2C01_078047 [Portunus trituberculatus]|uniref:Uncharacterized protein n=1 Tax=Portunus trituberculatus TaxID=210409 RepID=A0A5B7IMV0_PORTR|nr:hypothetical protein [Portunus trituberculatus]
MSKISHTSPHDITTTTSKVSDLEEPATLKSHRRSKCLLRQDPAETPGGELQGELQREGRGR